MKYSSSIRGVLLSMSAMSSACAGGSGAVSRARDAGAIMEELPDAQARGDVDLPDAQGTADAGVRPPPPPVVAATLNIQVYNTSTNERIFDSGELAENVSRAWTVDELGPVLADPTLSLSDTEVIVRAANKDAFPRQELLAFARDPAEHADTVAHIMDGAPGFDYDSIYGAMVLQWPVNNQVYDAAPSVVEGLGGILGPPWNEVTSSSTGLPRSLSLVTPSRNDDRRCLEAPCFVAAHQPTAFWGTAAEDHPSGAVAGLSDPSDAGSLRALYLYNHGVCSQEIQMATLLGAIPGKIWEGFRTTAYEETFVDWVQQDHNAITSYVDYDPGAEMKGGFIMAGMFHVNTYIVSDVYFPYMARYQFVLGSDGVLALQNLRVSINVDGHNEGEEQEKFLEILRTRLPSEFHAQAAAGQWAPIPGVDLTTAQNTMSLAMNVAASRLGITRADSMLLDAVIRDPQYWSGYRPDTGACTSREGSAETEPACMFRYVPKRLNVYPDSVEFVLVDDKEISPGFALYAAAVGSDVFAGNSDATDALCPRTVQSLGVGQEPGRDYTFRDYYEHSLGLETYDP